VVSATLVLCVKTEISLSRSSRGEGNEMTQPSSDDGGDSGYLYKWARVMKGWKKRYFVLDKTGVLRYYRDADSLADLRGTF